jgi:hypothetical protein
MTKCSAIRTAKLPCSGAISMRCISQWYGSSPIAHSLGCLAQDSSHSASDDIAPCCLEIARVACLWLRCARCKNLIYRHLISRPYFPNHCFVCSNVFELKRNLEEELVISHADSHFWRQGQYMRKKRLWKPASNVSVAFLSHLKKQIHTGCVQSKKMFVCRYFIPLTLPSYVGTFFRFPDHAPIPSVPQTR